ncbi:MAG: alkylhydroperoxidase-related (seleno)protein, partial [Gammaproteobacteria bacterium]
VELPRSVREVVRGVAVEPERLTREFYSAARDAGLAEEAYVEAVAVAAFTVNLDVFARGIGIDPLPLPEAADQPPPRTRPRSACEEGAWVATVPAGRRGGDEARALYGETMMPFIIRALSLVPAETRMHVVTEEAQYLPLARFAEYGYRHHRGLSRPQVEVIAGRVSALNACFY